MTREAPRPTGRRWRFHGQIAGLGTAEGTRLVVGHWRHTPWGPFSDVMVQRADGHRMLLAPTQQVADFVSATYRFDQVTITPVHVRADAREDQRRWRVAAGPLWVSFSIGHRTPLGWALRAVPAPLATSTTFASAADPIARVVLRGVRTAGAAGQDRREWYSATDVRAIAGLQASWAGEDLGGLRPVWPPVQFGFGSTPRRPSLTSVVTTVELMTGGPGSGE